MAGKEMFRREFNRLATFLVLVAVLAACTSMGQAQETIPAAMQTSGVEIDTASATPEFTATPENTATTTATATPEDTPTPKVPEFPSNINPIYKVNRDNLEFMDWGEGYETKTWRIYISTQDLHLDEPTITMGDGRYHIQGWADAWFMETDGTGHHITVPLIIFDTETYQVWTISHPVETWQYLDDNDQSDQAVLARKIITEEFTGTFNENHYATTWLERVMCFTASGERDCNDEYTQDPYYIHIGSIPAVDPNTRKYKDGMKQYVDFLRELLQDVYTKDNVETFYQTFDPDLLQLNEPNLPPNFIIPLRTN